MLSFVPLAIVAPTVRFPNFFTDEVDEHIYRHAAYAFAFTVSVGCCPRWPYVIDAVREGHEWATALIAYSVLGLVTLWWFVLSHAREDVWRLRTHQGDVSVLPLTLAAIATFVLDVPDDAFQYTRSTFFFVPIVVACATFHFLAYHGFALTQTTTYSVPSFSSLANAAAVMSASILLLIEMNASSFVYQCLPLSMAIFSQCVLAPRESVRVFTGRVPSVVLVGFAFGALTFAILYWSRLHHVHPLIVVVGGCGTVVQAIVLPPLVGLRWPFVGSQLATLITAVYVHVSSLADVVAVGLVFGIFLAYLIACGTTELLSSSVHPGGREDPPVECDMPWRDTVPTIVLRETWSSSSSATYQDCAHVWSARVLGGTHWSSGVWWVNTPQVSQDLLWVHEGVVRGGTFPPTFVGWVRSWGSPLCEYRIVGELSHGWVPTEVCLRVAKVLRIGRESGWICIRDPDRLERITYDYRGRLCVKYTMLRVCLSNGAKTKHHATFIRNYRGRPYLRW